MEGLLKFNDLGEHFYNSLIIIDQRNEIIKGKQNLEVIVSKLTEEIQVLKQSEQNLTQQLKTFSYSTEDQNGINSVYIKLKEKYSELQEKYNKLENEKIEFLEKCNNEKDEVTESFEKQLKVFEMEKVDQEKEFLKNQSDLLNKLATQQALADIRYDEMESNLKSQIKDISQKLHDSLQSCNTMRQELFSYKTYNSSDLDTAKKRIQELERELRLSKQQLQLNEQQKNFNSSSRRNFNQYPNNDDLHREIYQPRPTTVVDPVRPPTNVVRNRIVVYKENSQSSTSKSNYVYGTTKYPSLNVGAGAEQEASSSEEFQEILQGNVNTPREPLRTIQSGVTSFSKQNTKKYSVPPLKPLSVAQPKSKINNKKRKLYDPNNLDYLLDTELPD